MKLTAVKLLEAIEEVLYDEDDYEDQDETDEEMIKQYTKMVNGKPVIVKAHAKKVKKLAPISTTVVHRKVKYDDKELKARARHDKNPDRYGPTKLQKAEGTRHSAEQKAKRAEWQAIHGHETNVKLGQKSNPISRW